MTDRPGSWLRRRLRAFSRDERGQIAIIFALSVSAIFISAGAGLDLTRAYQARQMLYQVATLSCQYASRPSVVQMGNATYTPVTGGPTYTGSVNSYITAALSNQSFPWTQTTATPFTYAVNGPANVSLTSTVPTSFMQLVNVSTIPVSAASHCYDNPSSLSQTVPNGASPYLIKEGFEAQSNGGYIFIPIVGRTNATASSSFTQTANYTGLDGGKWYSTGYCLETDQVGIINATVAEGVRAAELDCDNGSGSAGNSATSTKVYLPVGNYELRYNYRSRVSYPNYDPAYLCGSTASDLSWANDTNSSGGPAANAFRTNQLNVYLDLNTTGSPPMHTTLDGSQQLAGSNLIDMCVYSAAWVERDVRIYVTVPGYYWISFAADGQNDSFGAQLDNIRLCTENCPGAVLDNFPSSWLAANNGGVNKILFEDTFDLPVYVANYYGIANTSGNLNVSYGTSGSALSGWPTLAASGWATAPYNSVTYFVTGSAQGPQSLQFDASTPSAGNRLASRAFLLVPGYYRLDYRYIADIFFSGLSGSYCGATPSAANVAALTGSASGTDRFFGSGLTANRDTNLVGVFMSHALLASTPNGGGSLNSATTYLNPNGTTSATPTVPPAGVSLTSYNASQPNPLLDICGYASTWQSRSATIAIQKTAYYWLTVAALGTGDTYGGAVDDVKLTALGSLYTSPAPANAIAIPVPDPQPAARVTFSGAYIVADPLTPPAPLQ